jgi:hypothetical protein
VAKSEHVRVVLDLETNEEPIRGVISRADHCREFHGWLELAHALRLAKTDIAAENPRGASWCERDVAPLP